MGIYYSSFASTILRSLRHGFCTSYMPLIPPMPWLCSFSRSFHLWPMAFFFSRRRCRRLWSIWTPARAVGRYFAQTGRISDEDFYAWSEQARAQKKKYDKGAITLEDFQRWLKES